MSLLRLLTAGRSLVGLKKAEVRYHLPNDQALPRFGSKKNPFRATALPEKADSAPESSNQPSEPQPGPESTVPAPVEAGGGAVDGERSDQTGDAKVEEGKGNADKQKALPADHEQRRGSGIKAFLRWGRSGKSKLQGPGRGALVQGELSLDRVKVVRNDLSESDLEVVRGRQPEASKAPAGPAAVPAKANGLTPAWGATACRFLGLSKR